MTIDQFLDLLKAHRHEATWEIFMSSRCRTVRLIRAKRRGASRRECPLTFLSRAHLRLRYTVSRWNQAGAALGLPTEARGLIVNAADIVDPGLSDALALRRRLLAALDLPADQEG